jgi:hypothetical protein
VRKPKAQQFSVPKDKTLDGTVPRDHVATEEAFKGMRGYQLIEHVPKSSYRDNSMSVVIPSRSPMLHVKFVQALSALQWSMNQKRALFHVTNAEVGKAYSEQVQAILSHPDLGKWRYILTLEDDTLPPPEAVQLLLESIEMGPFDAVGGLYFLKSDGFTAPQCYGDPAEYARTGVLDFKPRDIVAAMKNGGSVVECNGLAMGCTLFRAESFRKVPQPWFETSNSMTQDLSFCAKARHAGLRFACDTRVRCGHMDVQTGIVY